MSRGIPASPQLEGEARQEARAPGDRCNPARASAPGRPAAAEDRALSAGGTGGTGRGPEGQANTVCQFQSEVTVLSQGRRSHVEFFIQPALCNLRFPQPLGQHGGSNQAVREARLARAGETRRRRLGAVSGRGTGRPRRRGSSRANRPPARARAPALRVALPAEGSSPPRQPGPVRPATPGERPACPRATTRAPAALLTLAPSGARTNFLLPESAGRAALAGGSLTSLAFGRPGEPSLSAPFEQPGAPGAQRFPPAHPLQQSRRPGGNRERDWEWRRGRQSWAKTPLSRAGSPGRGSGDVAVRERRRKYPGLGRADAFQPLSVLALPDASRCPGGGGGTWQGLRRKQKGRLAWRANGSLTSVQSERLDHCQCRHVCRGSRSDARLQHQRPLVVRKRGGD